MYKLGTSSSNFRSPDGKELTRFFTVEMFLFREHNVFARLRIVDNI